MSLTPSSSNDPVRPGTQSAQSLDSPALAAAALSGTHAVTGAAEAGTRPPDGGAAARGTHAAPGAAAPGSQARGTRPLLARRIWQNKALFTGGGILLLILLIALLAPWISPHDPYVQNLANRTIPPVWSERGSWVHPLGTDQLGRDYLSRIFYGARISLLIGASVALISGIIGTVMGMAAGYFGGRVDMVVSFLVTTRLSMPVILVALATVAIVGGSLWVVILVLGLLKWDRFAVVMRSATQQVRSLEYVAAAQAAGASTWRIVRGEVLPNVVPHLIVIATLEAASAILLEASLSFLGLGVQPPLPSWGLMISEAKAYMFFSFWLISIPGTALALLIFAINLAGDGLHQFLTPQERT